MVRLTDLVLPALGVVVLTAMVMSEKLVQPTPQPGRVKVTYWEKWTGFEFDGMKAIVDDFNKSQDRIWVDILPISNIDQKTMMATSAGIPPDLAGLFGPNVPQYVDDNAVMPLDKYCAKYGINRSQYIPAYWDIGAYGGKLYSLPTTPASTALHYNTKMFKAAGLDPNKPPKTFKELDAYAEKITTKKNGTLGVSGFLPSEPGWWNWAWGAFYGGRLWDGESKITANSPENIRALKWVASYSEKYGPGDLQSFRSGFGNFSSPQNAFMAEKVAMEIQGVWMGNFISQYAPELEWVASPFPYPEDRPDLKDTAIVDEDVIVIPLGAKHPDEAFEFIAFMQKQKNMEKLCLSHQKNSPLRNISDYFWKEHKNPYIRLFDRLAYSKNAKVPPRIGIWAQYNSELIAAFDAVSLLTKTPEQALKDVDARMQPLLDQYIVRRKMRQGVSN